MGSGAPHLHDDCRAGKPIGRNRGGFQAHAQWLRTTPNAHPPHQRRRDTPHVQPRLFFTEELASRDPEIFDAIEKELGRQRDEIELIASENIVSSAVMQAQGSVMTNKYAEGYPGRRYYGGCEFVDIAENLAIDRAKSLFGCEFANVQPNSGSQANQGVYQALLQPGDTILGMSLMQVGT